MVGYNYQSSDRKKDDWCTRYEKKRKSKQRNEHKYVTCTPWHVGNRNDMQRLRIGTTYTIK